MLPDEKPHNLQQAAFGAGCFWGVEESFRNLPGVVATSVGYMGGTTTHPTYKQVCNGDTNHAEVVMVEFDPATISYEKLLDVFFALHDPTQLNRQGPDVGTQYRSVIFTYDPDQAEQAEIAKKRVADSGKYKAPVVTQVEPAPQFFVAEEYHQKYLQKQGRSSCHI